MKTPLKNWITQLKWAFYGALGYIALGISGVLGAILAIQLLLWIFTAYLAVSFAINVYAAVKTLQSIFAVLDDLHKACDFLPALFWGGDCDGFFSMIDKVIYGGAGVVLLFQSLTLICALLLIRRINKKTGRCCFTFCGHPRDKKRKQLENSLDKEIPYGRRRRVAGTRQLAKAASRSSSSTSEY
ncbi:hypothetical protein Rhopal_000647-T1 [Rhodotorula paludigena]|uniref:Uncharacterized protein n=1 Tax=Rhodotorula paludigena TaxID=86838 RepID=A0AAV5GED1_9BASI|nr:hypothetical protein Rhopal_000647-T1 [Rhodotorula paludigena]